MSYFSFLEGYSAFGNTYLALVASFCILVGIFLLFKIFEKLILVRLKRLSRQTENKIDDVLIDAIHEMGNIFYFAVGLYAGAKYLVLSDRVEMGIKFIFLAVVTYEIVRALLIVIKFALQKYSTKDGESAASESLVNLGMLFAKIILWSVGLLFVMSNLGIDITALVASLGIGSLAIALALQSILADMFSSFSIYADKPFEIGDYIVIGADSGTVKKIGLKTTRITTLQGEELVVSNKELTTVRVQNFKKMQSRRVAFTFGVPYETPQAKLEKIPGMLEKIISGIKRLEFDRCHFHELGDSSLLFDVVYHVDTREYDVYIDSRQEMNFELFATFEKEGVSFAYPTQTVIVQK
jgi:small-conductance mechanosensitive channel